MSRPSDCRGGLSRRSYRLFILSVNGINLLEGNASLDSIYDRQSNLKPGERVVTKVLRARVKASTLRRLGCWLL